MHFGISRARNIHHTREEMEDGDGLEQEFHDPERTKKSQPLTMCMQVGMIAIILIILFFGITVTLVGAWAHHSQNLYLSITMHPIELTRFPMVTLVTGIFVSGLALIGLAGSIFFRTITGQTFLGTFAFVMVLLIISELGAGAAVIRLKFNLLEVYTESAISSQMLYEANNMTSDFVSTASEWDHFQKTYECCGAEGFNITPPYYKVFGNMSVPTSCCNVKSERISDKECEMYAEDAVTYREYIYERGCPDAIFNYVEEYMLVIAICVIIAGFSQLCAVAFSVTLLYISSKLKSGKKTYQYNKLSLKGTRQIETT